MITKEIQCARCAQLKNERASENAICLCFKKTYISLRQWRRGESNPSGRLAHIITERGQKCNRNQAKSFKHRHLRKISKCRFSTKSYRCKTPFGHFFTPKVCTMRAQKSVGRLERDYQCLAQIANKHSGSYKASYKTYNRIGTES